MAPKILLVQLRQLGDILLTTPCIREIKRAWPDASIDFLAHPMGRLVLDGNPYLDQILTYDPKGNWREEWKLLRTLRRRGYDCALDFMYNPRSALYTRCSGAGRRLAFASRRAAFFTEIVAQSPSEIEYIVTEKFRYLRQLNIAPVSEALDLPWFAADARCAQDFFASSPDLEKAPLRIVLSPTHRRVERQWPVDRYAKLADRLQREWGAAVVWIWGPGEEDFVRQVQSLAREPTYLAPRTSFRELAALIAQCDLFVGNSNGPSHVAVAVETASLQIHGPTYAKTWCPDRPPHRALQAVTPSERHGPIDLISEEELWQALGSMRPQIEAAASRRKSQGPRLSWPGPIKIGREDAAR